MKGVLRILLGFALSPRTRAMVAAFLHRFDKVSDRRITPRDVGALRFDRTIRHWEPVFARAHWLLSGLYPDIRTGDAVGSALLFNMEKLFETVLGLRIRHACQAQDGGRLSVGLQSPVKNLATAGFQLRPDITIQCEVETVAILDAKWKRLDLGEANSGVSSGDADQMQPYAKNAKAHRPDQFAKIAASMAEFGWTVPCLVAEDGELIAGHGRVLAATQLGLTEAPVSRRKRPMELWTWGGRSARMAARRLLSGPRRGEVRRKP